MKRKILPIFLSASLLFLPMSAEAYSDRVIVGGDNIGIHIDSNGVLVIGFYKVDGEFQKGTPEISVGDVILKVNEVSVSSIKELTETIDKFLDHGEVTLTVKRDSMTFQTKLALTNVDGIYKTGLYVKDGISGIGTLTYVDPGTKIFGTLGHEIVENTTSRRIEVKTGTIFDSDVSKIIKSTDGKVGEKNAELYYDEVVGVIEKNTLYGVFGKYTDSLPSGPEFPVGDEDDVKPGDATIYTVLSNNKIMEYDIKITDINKNAEIKNIHFEITDERLLQETGGVVQGMSGSPIIQDGKIVGAVTHAIVDKVATGYGIFITTMLEEGER